MKGKILNYCEVLAITYGLETVALSEMHELRLQLCENSWIRRIDGVKRLE